MYIHLTLHPKWVTGCCDNKKKRIRFQFISISKQRLKGINLPKEIRELITVKRKLRKRWQQTRSPQDKNKLNQTVTALTREIKGMKSSTTSSFLKGLTAYKGTDYSLYKCSKYLKRPITHIPSIKRSDNQWARSDSSKAEVFAEHLAHRFVPNPGSDEMPSLVSNKHPDKVPMATVNEINNEIKKLKHSKAPGFDTITSAIFKNMCRKGVVKLTNLVNAAIRLNYVPMSWKVSEIIMIPKPGKNHSLVESYRPIALLPMMSKIFEKIIAKRLNNVIEKYQLIPNHQFGFRCNHSTIDQVHRITNLIEKSLEDKRVCSAVFLDMAQAFDRVWHRGLMHKLKSILPETYVQLLKSYLEDRKFRTRVGESYSELRNITAGVPQGSVLGPILYSLYINDVPEEHNCTLATYADDTAILTTGKSVEEATAKLERAAHNIVTWTRRWRIKLNEDKSVYINFTNKNCKQMTMILNGMSLQAANTAKYLGMTLDAKLHWKTHIKMKQEEIKIRFRKLYWLLGRRSELSIKNKVVLYKQVLRPVWAYGSQLWGCAKKSNVDLIQRSQNKILRSIVNAPWYARNKDIHRELDVETVTEVIRNNAESHQRRLQNHVNTEAAQLVYTQCHTRRLKRTKPFDLVATM